MSEEKRRWQFVFDIETGPCDPGWLEDRGVSPKVDSRLKDPAKIEAAKEEAQKKFALDPLTGKVLAIGVTDAETRQFYLFEGPEAKILERWWKFFVSYDRGAARWIGFNIFDFDIPFLILRSHMLGVRVPMTFRESCSKHTLRAFFDDVQDVVYAFRGNRWVSHGLDQLARVMLGAGKTGDGALFADLYTRDRAAAIAYLENDCRITLDMAVKVGLVAEKAEVGSEVAA